MRARTLGLLLMLTAAPTAAHAGPNISVLVDRLCLIADGKVPVVGGGLLRQQEIYSGPLLPFSKMANVEIVATEGTAAGDPTRTLARSLGTLNTAGFELLSVAEFNFPGPIALPPDTTIWDATKNAAHVAKGRLRWVFRSDADTTARFDIGNHGLQGFVAARLVDDTLGVILVDYSSSAVVFPQDTIDVKILAGHRYTLIARVHESHQQDDDEAFVRFTFDGRATIAGTGRGASESSCKDWAASGDLTIGTTPDDPQR